MTTVLDATQVAGQLAAAGIHHALTPADPGFAETLTGFNILLRHRPLAVVPAQTVQDVLAAVRVATNLGLPVTTLGHGHGVLDPIDSGIAIATTELAGVSVDQVARTATISAGTTWSAVLDAATPLGLAPLCGSAPHVGVVGYVLGGGLGPVARTYGFAADHVRSIDMVTAAGDLVTATADSHTDLYWALRGGKGGFGVVTGLTIDLFPLRAVYGGGLYFAAADASAVMHGFSEWSVGLPECVTASVAMLRLPPLPQLPEPLRGQFVVHVRVAVVGDVPAAERLVAPLRTLATPLIDAVGELPYAAIGSIHSDPTDPMPVVEGGVLLSSFDEDTVAALLAVAGPEVPAPLAAVEVRVLGGALSREPAVPNAVGGRAAGYSLHVVGAPVPELLDTVIPTVIHGVFDAVGPWRTGTTQANFFGVVNDRAGLRHSWSEPVAARLDAIRDRYDPAGRFPWGDHGSRRTNQGQ